MKRKEHIKPGSSQKNVNDIAIQLINISKKYEIHHEKPTLVEKFVKGRNETFWALRDINLTIKKGEKVGIFGSNGSGKTTLLKIITGITSSTIGDIYITGKVVSLIDLEAGFHGDLTGEQNVYLNGMLLGMTQQEMNEKMKSIINFADIKQFIDAPLFTYSSGMVLRLGFAIAIHSNPDILILDEGIIVGDANFQQKAQNKLSELVKNNITVVTVSHRMDSLENFCTKFIWMQHGKIKMIGKSDIIGRYLKY